MNSHKVLGCRSAFKHTHTYTWPHVTHARRIVNGSLRISKFQHQIFSMALSPQLSKSSREYFSEKKEPKKKSKEENKQAKRKTSIFSSVSSVNGTQHTAPTPKPMRTKKHFRGKIVPSFLMFVYEKLLCSHSGFYIYCILLLVMG